jgi:hypothetical protein
MIQTADVGVGIVGKEGKGTLGSISVCHSLITTVYRAHRNASIIGCRFFNHPILTSQSVAL